MPSIWQSFIPYNLAKDFSEHPDQSPLEREQRFEAITLFADVSGFTTLSESLGTYGKKGTEELTRILNRYFGTMITTIQSYGGIIVKFGGDAMTVLFPYTVERKVSVAQRAIQSALEMQSQMADYADIQTLAGSFSITMKVGLATGSIFCTTVGELDKRLEFIVAGKALDLCAEAEHQAKSGEIVIHQQLAEMVSGIQYFAINKDYSQIVSLAAHPSLSPLAPIEAFSNQAVQIIARFIHPSIAKRILREQFSFINEHRKVTVLFASFTGFDFDHDPDIKEKLQDYFQQVIRKISQYDGYLNKIDMGDKGNKFITLFGAPITHENDIERALRCALDLRSDLGSSLKIGIATGFVFCGQIGSDDRREYTVMGDTVNLAARLMQVAEYGQIFVSNETQKASSSRFEWGPQNNIQVKGKTLPVTVFPVVGLRQRRSFFLQKPDYALPMVGRSEELTFVQKLLEDTLTGNGQVIGITAEAGMGKSRLVAEIINAAFERGFNGFGGECLSYGTNVSYLVWRNILRGIFNIHPAMPFDELYLSLSNTLSEINSAFPQRMPLLGIALNAPIPDNDFTQYLEAKVRKESLESLLVEVLRYFAQQNPLLFVFEDYHWADPLSKDLLETIERNIVDLPICILEVYRSSTESDPANRQIPHFTEIQLQEFTIQETSELIKLKLAQLFDAQMQLPPDLQKRITERAQGNPFYIDEMINLIHDRNLNPLEMRTLELPDSLHNLIISRIDQLTEASKTTLKVASVIGRTFKVDWLLGVYPKLGSQERIQAQLDELRILEISPIDPSEPEIEYLFKHIITRDVAYESLAIATRTRLHEQIGKYIERSFPSEIDQFLDLLAHHYSLSNHQEKKRGYLLKAGEAAQSAYANQAAIDYYRKLCDVLNEDDRPEILSKLSQVMQLTGNWDEAIIIAQQGLEIAQAHNNLMAQALCQQSIGTIKRLQGQYETATEHLSTALRLFSRQDNLVGVNDTTNQLGLICWNQGNLEQALMHFTECQNISQTIGSSFGEFRAASNIGLVYWYQGDPSQALTSFQKGKEIAGEINDRYGLGTITGNMGNVYLDQGNYELAFDCYNQHLQAVSELGLLEGISIAAGNLGNVYVEQGEYQHALDCYTFTLQIAQEMGDPMGIGLALWYLGYTYIELDKYEQARHLLEKAIEIARNLDIPYELSDFLYTYAECQARQNLHAEALKCAQEALQIASEVDNQLVMFQAQILVLRLAQYLNKVDLETTVTDLEALVAQDLESPQDEKDQAALHYAIWKVDNAQEVYRSQAAHLYKLLYEKSPNIEYKHRYEELTGGTLPDPPPLPPVPEIIQKAPIDLNQLLQKI